MATATVFPDDRRSEFHDAWQGALSIFALLSVVTYAGVNAYYFALFAELGVTPAGGRCSTKRATRPSAESIH